MTPRIITADEARVLREAATPGPWRVTDYDTVAPSIGCGGWDIAVVHGDDDGRPWDADDSEPVAPLPLSDAALIAAAPDLAATVEALHAEVARLRALVREAYREGFAASDEMGWHSDDSASETRWLASAARAALEATP